MSCRLWLVVIGAPAGKSWLWNRSTELYVHFSLDLPCTESSAMFITTVLQMRTLGLARADHLPRLPQGDSDRGNIRTQEGMIPKLGIFYMGLLLICDDHTDRIFQRNILYTTIFGLFLLINRKKAFKYLPPNPRWTAISQLQTLVQVGTKEYPWRESRFF